MASDLLLRTMDSDGVVNQTNWSIPDSVKSSVSQGVTELHDQMPAWPVLVLGLVAAIIILKRCRLSHLWVIVPGYFMADVYMAVLHMWLDHPRTRSCPVGLFKGLALDFQNHHKNPFHVVVSNHVGTIDILNAITLATPIVWALATKLFTRKSMPPQLTLFAFVTTCSGILAAYNHVCCHARTHKVPIPAVIAFGQDLGVLPHNEFHRTHHTPPHDSNFAFLSGGAPAYDFLYTNLQMLFERYYDIMSILFVFVQPFVVNSLLSIVVLLRAAPKVEAASDKKKA
eukprot:CAMPEP_0183403894 /NCGR_PEP_ID=MMETSP0370-20130417/14864_1 /TAXON_ID=268820 /ORGANISM="Peridinium aciculiferum, Strain PAER-2" /LENGTH=283 /DNA_ID=CAMNT_0025585697 /DNA_START=54 /DNA_END=905 /DNA_ORIENTATION=+